MKHAPGEFKSHLKKLLGKADPRHGERVALAQLTTRLQNKEDPKLLWREVTCSSTDRDFLLKMATQIAKYSLDAGISLTRDRAIPPDVQFFTALLTSCRLEKDVDQCLDEMTRFGVEADIVCSNSVIKAFGNVGCLQRAFSTFSKMKQIDRITVHALIGACAKNGKEDEAMRAYKLGLERGVKPDAAVVTVLIDATYRSGNFSKTWDLWHLYKHHGNSPDIDGAKLQLHLCSNWLDDTTFNPIKPSMDKIFHRIEEALDVVAWPRYTISGKVAWLVRMLLSKKIIALAKLGRIEDSFLVMERHMKKRSKLPLDILVINTFLTHVANTVKSLPLAERAIRLMKTDPNLKADAFTLTAIMTSFGDAGYTKLATETFERMAKDGGFAPTAICYASLITACGKNRDLKLALRAFNMAKDAGLISPEVRSAIMEAHVRAGLAEKAFSFDDPWAEPNLRVFNSLIDACAQFRDMRRAWEYFWNMTEAKIAPDLRTLHTLLECKRSQARRDAQPTVVEILNACRSVEFTFQTYFLLLELATEPGQKDAIKEEMRVKGLMRQHIAFAKFMLGGSIVNVVNGPAGRGDFLNVDPELCGGMLKEIEVTAGWVEQDREARFHAEKKAFCHLQNVLRQDEPFPTIQLSLRMCSDCHQFFHHAATWAKKRIVIHDISRIHVFMPNRECSCGEGFKPWVRSAKVCRAR